MTDLVRPTTIGGHHDIIIAKEEAKPEKLPKREMLAMCSPSSGQLAASTAWKMLVASPTPPSPSRAADLPSSTSIAAELPWVDAAVQRATEATSSFAADVTSLPTFDLPVPPKSRAREIFEHFDVDASGCLGFDEVLHGLRAMGLYANAEEARRLFDSADKDGSGKVSTKEFAGVVEGIAHLREGRATDSARLLQAASVLHAQALSEPLVLVAEGEVVTLLKCAAILPSLLLHP